MKLSGLNYSTQSIYLAKPRLFFLFLAWNKQAVIRFTSTNNKKIHQRDDLCAPSLKFRSVEFGQKIAEEILSSNLRQQCVN